MIENTNLASFNIPGQLVFKYNRNDFVNNGLNFYTIISRSWRILKSGSNTPYRKSRVFKYMFNNGMRWDKRKFKVKLFELINNPVITNLEFKHILLVNNNEPIDVSEFEEEEDETNGYYSYDDNPDYEDSYFFGRALLGLAEHYEFRTNQNDRIYQFKVKSDSIDRFKSPVTFKVFDNQIFVFVGLLPKAILDATFTFDLVVKNPLTHTVVTSIDDFTEMPTPKHFSLDRFFKSNFSYVGFGQV